LIQNKTKKGRGVDRKRGRKPSSRQEKRGVQHSLAVQKSGGPSAHKIGKERAGEKKRGH